jgi:MFS family permease
MAIVLAHHPIRRRAGTTVLLAVGVFGLATILFGLSQNLYLSLTALVIAGAADMVSVMVRSVLVQSRTPEAMRGRVSAINMVFIGASNELGEFESGVAAAWMGVVPSVVFGGVATLAVVAICAWAFPALRKANTLTDAPTV